MITTAKAVAIASLKREKSVGGHVRLDKKTSSLFSKPYSTLVKINKNNTFEACKLLRQKTPLKRIINYKISEKFRFMKAKILRILPESISDKIIENKYKNKNWEQRIKDFDVIQRLSQTTTSILEFLEAYILEPIYLTEALPKGNEDDVVTVITIHSAKGAECKRCYVLNVSPGGYPITRSMNSGESIEEERRVLYVAMTRAKDELIITRSGNFLCQLNWSVCGY